MKNYLRSLFKFIKQIRGLLYITVVVGGLSLAAGIILRLTVPQFGPDSNALKDIAFNGSTSSLSLVGLLFARDTFVEILVLLSSSLTFGIAGLFVLSGSFFGIGSSIAWYGTNSGTGLINGFEAYVGHVLFYLIAFSLAAATSLWIAIGWLKPETGKSRYNSSKARLRQGLIILPPMIVLIGLGSIIEGLVSANIQVSSARQVISDPEMKTISGPDNAWSIAIPSSWEETDGTTSGSMGVIPDTSFIDKNLTLFVDVKFGNPQGIKKDQMFSVLSNSVPNVAAKQGLRLEGKAETVSIAGYAAYRFIEEGKDNTLSNKYLKEVVYYVPVAKAGSATFRLFVLTIAFDPNHAKLISPLADQIVNSFTVKS